MLKLLGGQRAAARRTCTGDTSYALFNLYLCSIFVLYLFYICSIVYKCPSQFIADPERFHNTHRCIFASFRASSMGAALRKADCDIRRVFKIVAAALYDAGDQGTGGEVLRARCLPVRVSLAKSLWRTWRSLLPFGTWIRSPLATSRVLKEAICKRTIQCSVRTVDHEGFRDAADLVGCLLGLSDPDCAWLDSWIWMRADFTAKQCALDPDLEVDAEEQARAMQARECRLLCSSRHPSPIGSDAEAEFCRYTISQPRLASALIHSTRLRA